MHVDAWAMSHRGLKRQSNQDSCLIDEELGLYIVADGMGGHQGGEVASKLAVETLREAVKAEAGKLSPPHILHEAYRKASQKIYDEAEQSRPELKGMGTTLVCVYEVDNCFYIANVGDSRGYVYRYPRLWQVTEDHSLVNEQLRAGLLSDWQVGQFAGKNVITRSVGYEPKVECDVIVRRPEAGEIYLLCSDGLYGLMPDERIAELLGSTAPAQLPTACIDEALARGGDDNVTVMVLRVSENEE